MKKNDQNKSKTSQRAAQILVDVKPDELQSVTGGGCRSCGIQATTLKA